MVPLITAAEGFPALEDLVAGGRQSVLMSFRVFDPATRLRSSESGDGTWLDLLGRKAREGVRIRVLLSDFDPIGAPDLHAATWRAAAALRELEADGPIEIMPVRHEARVGRGLRFGFWLPAAMLIERHRRNMNAMPDDERRAFFAVNPGLWRYLRLARSGRVRWRLALMPRLFPASIHQKIAVADDRNAVIGGLDVDERRWDDPDHGRDAHQTWHDVSVRVDGEIAADIARHIADTWNANRLRMAALRREQRRKAPPGGTPFPAPASLIEIPGAARGNGGEIQLLRTVSSTKRRQPFRFSPDPQVREIEDAHLDLIGRTERALYIETQFFRSQVIAEALAAAARRARALELVMILPGAPEEVAFDDKTGIPERMGEHLQSECVDMVRDAFGDRCAILSPVRPVRPNTDSELERDRLHGAQIVYVHSKVAIGDTGAAIVGSANLNGRSLRWDTEAAVLCTHGGAVADLRRRLLGHWVPRGGPEELFELDAFARSWWRHATANAAVDPENREGFLVPYDPEAAADLGIPVPGMPENMV